MKATRYLDLTGKRFSRLVVIGTSPASTTRIRWLCKCDCGTEREVRSDCLIQGKVQSCGCLHRDSAAAVSRATAEKRRRCWTINAGDRFGQLVAVEYLWEKSNWRCKCDCGNEKIARTCSLTSGEVISCGCDWRDRVAEITRKRETTHGQSKLPHYSNWKSLMNRCTKPNDPAYKSYGARGIVPCKAVAENPATLIKVMGEKPSPNHSIDRINNDLGYFCGECDECVSLGRKRNIRWATQKEQLRNRRNNTLFSLNGETKCAGEWAEMFGLTRNQFIYRYRQCRVA